MKLCSTYQSPDDLDLFLKELETLESRCADYLTTDVAHITTRLCAGLTDTDFVETLVDCFHLVRYGKPPSFTRGLHYRDEFGDIAYKLCWTTHDHFWKQVSLEGHFAAREHRFVDDYNDTDPEKDRLTPHWHACVHYARPRRDAWLRNPKLFATQFARAVVSVLVDEVSRKMIAQFLAVMAKAPRCTRNQAIEKYWARYGGYYSDECYSTPEYRALEYDRLIGGHRYKMYEIHQQALRLNPTRT